MSFLETCKVVIYVYPAPAGGAVVVVGDVLSYLMNLLCREYLTESQRNPGLELFKYIKSNTKRKTDFETQYIPLCDSKYLNDDLRKIFVIL